MPSRLGRAVLELDTDNEGLNEGLDKAESRVGKFGKAAVLGFAGLGVAAAGALAGAVQSSIELSDELRAVESRTGIAAGELQALRNVAAAFGSEDPLEGVVDTAQELSLRLRDGHKGAAEALDQLGLSAERLRQQSPTAAMLEVVNALQAIEDQGARNIKADELFGGSWEHISGILAASQEEFQGAVEAQEGVWMATQQLVDQTRRGQAAWRGITLAFSEGGTSIRGGIMRTLADFLELVLEWVPTIKEWRAVVIAFLSQALMPLNAEFNFGAPIWRELWQIISEDLQPAMQDLWESILGITEPFQALNAETGIAVDWVDVLGTTVRVLAQILNVALLAAIGAATNAVNVFKIGLEIIMGVIRIAIKLVQGDFRGAWEELGNTVERVWQRIKRAVQDGVNGAIRVVNGLIRGFNTVADKIPGLGSLPSLPSVALAEGGIVTSPTTALIGERGPEAVIPLNRLQDFLSLHITLELEGEVVTDLVVDRQHIAAERGFAGALA